MIIEYDSNKSQKNEVERSLSFEQAADFEWETSTIKEDKRKPYPEQRFIASGFLNKRLHVLCFANIENGIRVISFRKANKREVKAYEKAKTINK